MKKILVVLLVVVASWSLYNRTGQVQLGPGVMAPNAPQQDNLSSPRQLSVSNYAITQLAQFDLKAKVLSKKNYHFGREADLSPVDLALGWGRMSDEQVLDNIKISQANRFFYWRVDTFPIPRQEIETHSANMHLIPANKAVKKAMGKIRTGDIVEISGSLVNVASHKGDWYWNSSMTRNDTGNGACELVWVEHLQILTP